LACGSGQRPPAWACSLTAQEPTEKPREPLKTVASHWEPLARTPRTSGDGWETSEDHWERKTTALVPVSLCPCSCTTFWALHVSRLGKSPSQTALARHPSPLTRRSGVGWSPETAPRCTKQRRGRGCIAVRREMKQRLGQRWPEARRLHAPCFVRGQKGRERLVSRPSCPPLFALFHCCWYFDGCGLHACHTCPYS